MDYKQMTSPCGLDCFNCTAYLANEDMSLRAKISKKRNLSLEKARCAGCRNAQGTISFQGDTKPCAVFRCTSEKGIAYCYECAEFPCDHLHPYADQASFRQHNTKIFNLCLIKKMGLEQWAKDKAANVKETYFSGKLRVHGIDEKEQEETPRTIKTLNCIMQKGGVVMLDKTDIDKIEKINSDLQYVHKSFTSRDSKCYEHYMKLLNHAMKEKSLTKTNKELIAVGISAYVYCEPCITYHIREALRGGATDDQIVEAVEVAIEMGGGPVVARSANYAFKVLEYYKLKSGDK